MPSKGRPRTGEYGFSKIVPVKIDKPNFKKLRRLQQEAHSLIRKGERSESELEQLADTLRATLYDYIEKIEDFVKNGTSMKEEEE